MSTSGTPAPRPRPPLARPGGFGPHMTTGERAGNFGPSARRLLARLTRRPVHVLAVVAIATTSVVLNVLGPRVLGHAADAIFDGVIGAHLPDGTTKADAVAHAEASGQHAFADVLARSHAVPGHGIDFAHLRNLLLAAMGLYVGASLLALLQGRVLNHIVQRAMQRLRGEVEQKLHRLPLPYFDGRPRGEILSRVTNDIDNVAQSLQHTLSQSFTALLTVIGVLVMMFIVSPVLAIVGLLTVPVSMAVSALVARRSQRLFAAQWKQTGELNGHIEEAITGHHLVRLFGRQDEVLTTFATHNDALARSTFGAQFVSGLMMPMVWFIGNLSYVVLAVLGGVRVASGAMTVGEVQAFIQYSRQFTQPLTQLASVANVAQSGIASAERVFELLDAPEQVPDAPVGAPSAELAEEPSTTTGQVELRDVTFTYTPGTPLIEHLSLTVRPGQTVAIVGPTGAGKTTLVNLIMRFYEIDGGAILLDGVDTRSMTRHALRSRVGMVLQDTWLFEGTIRDNIAYGKPGATDDEVVAAAEAAHADRFIRSLPDGYDTTIDTDGSHISAGEKQLLTIARAFISQPSLLILDEATSSVDTRTELLVQRAMATLRQDRTSFVIAHRLSTIRDADVVLVMEAGRIVEQGTHDELLALDGAYAALYRSQFAGAEDAA